MQNRDSDSLVILGSGPSVWQELQEMKERMRPFDIMAINQVMLGLEKDHQAGKLVKHWVSLHPAEYFPFKALLGVHEPITHSREGMADMLWPDFTEEGTSALFALKVALALGYKKIVLCAITLRAGKRFFDNPYGPETKYDDLAIQIAWDMFAAQLGDRKQKIRATIGKPVDLFGYPSQEWING